MSDDTKPAGSSSTAHINETSSSSGTKDVSQPTSDIIGSQSQTQAIVNDAPLPATAEVQDRTELLNRARTFLVSPQVQNQDLPAKRAFLREKGLDEVEIENLLRNLPLKPPSIPPRTYPQPPPSNLPVLLLGLARLFTWLAGGSAVLLLLYRRFLFPRITQTWLARHSLKSHQLALLRQLTTSLASLKEAQSESFSALPHSDPFPEPQKYAECNAVAEILKVVCAGEKEPDFTQLPVISLLRCGIKEVKEKPTTEELFRLLEDQIPWLQTEEGLEFEHKLWDTLSTCPLFGKTVTWSSSSSAQSENTTQPTHWEYIPPTPAAPVPLLQSLDSLASELPKDAKSRKNLFQHTLQTMSDFTGYLSTQVYMPYRSSAVAAGIPSPDGQTSLEDDLRREIRALKGLVLNRRSFMPSVPRHGSSSSNYVRTTP